MSDSIYKAALTLSLGENLVTTAFSAENKDKEAVVEYCKSLQEKKAILAWRLLFKPEGATTWYYGGEVLYLPDDFNPKRLLVSDFIEEAK